MPLVPPLLVPSPVQHTFRHSPVPWFGWAHLFDLSSVCPVKEQEQRQVPPAGRQVSVFAGSVTVPEEPFDDDVVAPASVVV